MNFFENDLPGIVLRQQQKGGKSSHFSFFSNTKGDEVVSGCCRLSEENSASIVGALIKTTIPILSGEAKIDYIFCLLSVATSEQLPVN